MDLTCSLGHICLIIFAFTYSSNCQFHTTGYAYQLISGLDRDSSLSPELMHLYHNCWMDNVCKYVAKVKRTGKYVSLNTLEEAENIKYSGIWKKRVEDVDECASNPCQNDAACVNRIGAFSCICTNGQIGPLCPPRQWEKSCGYKATDSIILNTATLDECLSACITKKLEGVVTASYYLDFRECICSKSKVKILDTMSYCIEL